MYADLHAKTIRPAVMTAKMTSVVPVTVATCRHPSAAIPLNDVPSPSADIASNNPHVDASINGALIHASIRANGGNAGAMLLRTHKATKTIAKTGIGTLAAVVVTLRRAKNQPIARTSGSMRNTRNSLTMTAVLPAVSRPLPRSRGHSRRLRRRRYRSPCPCSPAARSMWRA